MSQARPSTKTIWLSHIWGPTCPAYGGGESIVITKVKQTAVGDSSNSLHVSASNHIGTHIDLPFHFIADGRQMNDFSPEDFIFEKPLLIDVKLEANERHIGFRHVEHCFKDMKCCDALLLRTGAENYRQDIRYWQDGPGLDLGLAEFIRHNAPNCKAVGIDAISITAFSDRERGRRVHREFLGGDRPLLLLEDMKLREAQAGFLRRLIVAPLRIDGADGAPVTVFGELM